MLSGGIWIKEALHLIGRRPDRVWNSGDCHLMRIKRIRVFHFAAPFVIGFHSPHRLAKRADSIILEVEATEGIIGYGECVPRSYITGETCSTVAEIISSIFPGILLTWEFNSIPDAVRMMSRLESLCRSKSIPAYNAALCAVDIALLDITGKLLRKPAHALLGPVVRDMIPSAVSIPFLPISEYRAVSSELRKMHFHSYKVLMGADKEENRHRLRQVRDVMGKEIDLRVEANGKWSFDQALSNIEAIKEFNISAVEQPLRKDDLEGMRRIRRETGLSVIADESLCSPEDAVKLIEEEACDILNIKISKCGGLLCSWQISELARSKGILCQLGTHVGETGILTAAGNHLAAVIRNLTYFENGSHLLFEKKWNSSRSVPVSIHGSGLGGPEIELPREHTTLLAEL